MQLYGFGGAGFDGAVDIAQGLGFNPNDGLQSDPLAVLATAAIIGPASRWRSIYYLAGD